MFGNPNLRQKFTETIKVVIPSALRTGLSLESGGISKIRNYDANNDWKYRTLIRGMV